MAEIVEVSDQNFQDEVLASGKPVLVDFWAEWCHPCHLVAPEVKALAEERGERLKVAKLNVDFSPETAARYGVMSIPTLLLFVQGVEKVRVVGARRKEAILSEIESYL